MFIVIYFHQVHLFQNCCCFCCYLDGANECICYIAFNQSPCPKVISKQQTKNIYCSVQLRTSLFFCSVLLMVVVTGNELNYIQFEMKKIVYRQLTLTCTNILDIISIMNSENGTRNHKTSFNLFHPFILFHISFVVKAKKKKPPNLYCWKMKTWKSVHYI